MVKQLHGDEGTLGNSALLADGVELVKLVGAVMPALAWAGNCGFGRWPSFHGEKAFTCVTSPTDRERGMSMPWPVGYRMEFSKSSWAEDIHVEEGSKISLVLDGMPKSLVSKNASSPSDEALVLDNEPRNPSFGEPIETDQLVLNENIGVPFALGAIAIACESNMYGDDNPESIMAFGLAMLRAMLEVLIGRLAFGLPALEDGLYLQSVPQVRHREQIGRALLHLTLAKKHPSHEALSRWIRGFADALLDMLYAGNEPKMSPLYGCWRRFCCIRVCSSDNAVMSVENDEEFGGTEQEARMVMTRGASLEEN